MDSLKTMSSGLQPCDELTMLNSDIERQLVLLKGIEKTLTSSCQNSSILSPTIFQSNLYAKNWIYGNQTLDDVIQQYTQRSLEYPNVTNCPISHPYFDGKACIVCTAPKNVFNLLTQKCT